jgi:ubiquinone/menaquinone biosynthesis C-methylase UbiE
LECLPLNIEERLREGIIMVKASETIAKAKKGWETSHSRGWGTRLIGENAYKFFVPAIEPGDAVGELAFGPSEFLKMIKEQAGEGKVIGLDISEKAVKNAKEKIKKEDIELIQADAHRLPLKDEIFDKLLMVDFFGMYPKPICVRLLKEAHRVLKPGGTLMFTAYSQKVKGTPGYTTSYGFSKEGLLKFISAHLKYAPKVRILPLTADQANLELAKKQALIIEAQKIESDPKNPPNKEELLKKQEKRLDEVISDFMREKHHLVFLTKTAKG